MIILTEVPGNPGWSVGNRPEVFRDAVLRNWSGPTPRWFTCSPAGFASLARARWSEVTFESDSNDGRPSWRLTSRKKVEAVVGGALPALPAHEELLRMVLEAGGSLEEPQRIQLPVIVPVDELPPPHNPFKCAHHDRFERLAREHPELEELEIGRVFAASLTPSDYAACACHRGDWQAIAAAAVDAVQQYGSTPTRTQLAAVASRFGLAPDDRFRLRTLFGAEAITISSGRFQDGQHRACALRAAGATEVVVAVDGPPSGPPSSWTFLSEN